MQQTPSTLTMGKTSLKFSNRTGLQPGFIGEIPNAGYFYEIPANMTNASIALRSLQKSGQFLVSVHEEPNS